MGFISDIVHAIFEPFESNVLAEINHEIVPITLDTTRNTLKTVDNISSKLAYTIRDTKSELLHFLDSAVDNMCIIANHNIIHVIDTIQLLSVISTSVLLLLIFLNYHKILEKGISLGSFNIL